MATDGLLDMYGGFGGGPDGAYGSGIGGGSGTGGGSGAGGGGEFDSWQSWAEAVQAARLGPELAGLAGLKAAPSSWGSQPSASDYYDPVTLMPKISDASTAAREGGTTLQGLAGGFFPRYVQDNVQGYKIPSDRGGFFNIEDLYRQLGRDVPGMGASGRQGPSTNNWRLLGMGPGWIMRNGSLIDAFSTGGRWGGPPAYSPNMGNTGEQSMPANGIMLGTGVGLGVPNLNQAGLGFPTSWGWPGGDQWNSEGAMSRTY